MNAASHTVLWRPRTLSVVGPLVTWLAVGCGQAVVTDDAFVNAVDASTPGPDAPADVDGDGILSSLDCNDSDPMVDSSATRACTSDCGEGNETCSNGIWSACSAPTDCDCTTPGATRIAVCGNCGMQSQTCTGGRWTPGSACLNEGECAVGAVESMSTRGCGERQRICAASCSWGEWTQTVPNSGECLQGDRMPCDFVGSHACDETCHWTTECV